MHALLTTTVIVPPYSNLAMIGRMHASPRKPYAGPLELPRTLPHRIYFPKGIQIRVPHSFTPGFPAPAVPLPTLPFSFPTPSPLLFFEHHSFLLSLNPLNEKKSKSHLSELQSSGHHPIYERVFPARLQLGIRCLTFEKFRSTRLKQK